MFIMVDSNKLKIEVYRVKFLVSYKIYVFVKNIMQ